MLLTRLVLFEKKCSFGQRWLSRSNRDVNQEDIIKVLQRQKILEIYSRKNEEEKNEMLQNILSSFCGVYLTFSPVIYDTQDFSPIRRILFINRFGDSCVLNTRITTELLADLRTLTFYAVDAFYELIELLVDAIRKEVAEF